MAPRTVYANLPDGLANLNLWDMSLADMGSLGVIPCTAAGTNAIVLTPIALLYPPNINNPPNANQCFSFVASATSTGAVTVQIANVTGFLKLYRMDASTQAASGDVQINVTYVISFGAALNGAVGGFQIQSPVNNEINPIITGATISASTITTSTYNGNTWTAGTGTLTLGSKTLVASNSLTLAGTDATTMTFPTTSATIARTDAGQTFTGTNAFGVLTATTINGNTFTAGTYTLTGVAGKTLTFNNSLTLAGTDSTTMTFPTTSATIARTDAGQTFTGTQNLASLTASSAVATDGSKNLVSVTNTGSGNNVLATSPSLTTPNIGAATATSVTFSPTTGGIVGTTTNDNASSGTVGEYIESVIAIGSAVSLVNGTAKDITTISLTAGDWDVSGLIGWAPGATTTVGNFYASLSTSANTLDQTNGRFSGWGGSTQSPAGVASATPVGPVRFSLAGTTTIHLVAQSAFGTSTMAGYGLLRARRMR